MHRHFAVADAEDEAEAIVALRGDLEHDHVAAPAGRRREREHPSPARLRLRAPQHPRIVRVRDEDAGLGEALVQLGLRVGDRLHRAEPLEVGRRGERHDADVRLRDRREPRDLAGVAHAHLDDRGAVLRPEAEERQRDADLVVEVALGLQDGAARREDRGDHLARGGLPVRAGDADDRDVEAPPVVARDRAERGEGVRDREERQRRGLGRAVLRDDRRGRALRGGLGDVRVAVEALAGERDEERARREGARVGRDASDLRGRCADPAPAGRGGELVGGEAGDGHAVPRARRASSRSEKGCFVVPTIW